MHIGMNIHTFHGTSVLSSNLTVIKLSQGGGMATTFKHYNNIYHYGAHNVAIDLFQHSYI